jgi:hypothetical protein
MSHSLAVFTNASPCLPLRAVVDVHLQLRGEAVRLVHPVAHDRHRDDEQRRLDAVLRVLALVHDRGQQLDGLAQAHVVREARTEAERSRNASHAEPAELIGPERALETFGLLEHRE